MPFLTPQQQKAEMAHLAQGRVPFYYSKKDIAAGKAAESVSMNDLGALALAHKQAVDAGILRPDVSEYALANALRENRPDLGVTDSPWNDPNFRKSPASKLVAKDFDAYNEMVARRDALLAAPRTAENGKALREEYDQLQERMEKWHKDPDRMARTAVAVLASKQRPDRSADEVIRRWNGDGPLSHRHLKHVQNMKQMLSHPANARVVEFYNAMMKPQRSAAAE